MTGEDKSNMIITASVRHSQSVTVSPLKPWVAAENCGTIICSHCTCMAGLGEACSHIAALLLAIEAHNRLNNNTSCTSQPCAGPSLTMQNVAYAPILDINFTAPTTKRKQVLEGNNSSRHSQPEFVPTVKSYGFILNVSRSLLQQRKHGSILIKGKGNINKKRQATQKLHNAQQTDQLYYFQFHHHIINRKC